jgi:hypothetical protein
MGGNGGQKKAGKKLVFWGPWEKTSQWLCVLAGCILVVGDKNDFTQAGLRKMRNPTNAASMSRMSQNLISVRKCSGAP